jgi:hypothetical protein
VPVLPTDEESVSALLQAYKQAYESLNADAVAGVVPLDAAQVRQLDSRLKQLASFNVVLSPQAPVFDPDRVRATVACDVTITQTARGGERTRPVTSRRIFDVVKSEGSWKIARVR